ncbi:hypothetical protein RFI_37067, partial [Reticulomyxa filosa]
VEESYKKKETEEISKKKQFSQEFLEDYQRQKLQKRGVELNEKESKRAELQRVNKKAEEYQKQRNIKKTIQKQEALELARYQKNQMIEKEKQDFQSRQNELQFASTTVEKQKSEEKEFSQWAKDKLREYEDRGVKKDFYFPQFAQDKPQINSKKENKTIQRGSTQLKKKKKKKKKKF